MTEVAQRSPCRLLAALVRTGCDLRIQANREWAAALAHALRVFGYARRPTGAPVSICRGARVKYLIPPGLRARRRKKATVASTLRMVPVAGMPKEGHNEE